MQMKWNFRKPKQKQKHISLFKERGAMLSCTTFNSHWMKTSCFDCFLLLTFMVVLQYLENKLQLHWQIVWPAVVCTKILRNSFNKESQ